MNQHIETKPSIGVSTAVEETVYKIGDLAREFDVTLRTLRFYEDRGLLTPERVGTTRLYSAHDRGRLSVIVFCKRIGLTLTDICKVLKLHEMNSDVPLAETQIRDVYSSQLLALEQQQIETSATIVDLQRKIQTMTTDEISN